MYLIKLAFDNLKYNLKRTFSLIALLTISTCAVILYQGYVEYCREGMATGYISTSGHLEIATKDFWNGSEEADIYINDDQLNQIYQYLKTDENIKFFDTVLDFGGLAGYNNNSTVFWGKGYDHPEKYFGASQGLSVFEGDEQIMVGKTLAQKLCFSLDSENKDLSFMCNSPESGICLGSLEVQGLVDTGVPQNDKGLVISTREVALNLLDMDNAASYLQIFLVKNNLEEIKESLQKNISNISPELIVKDWMELNPSFKQVNDMNETQFFVISIMIGILIIISIMQTLSTAFMERMGEFGTLEAIGLNKSQNIMMLFFEIIDMFVISVIFSFLICISINKITSCLNITMTPPGYDTGFPLVFLFVHKKVFLSFCFIFICCITASIYPIFSICKSSAIKLINRK